jgi:hypothetical protein
MDVDARYWTVDFYSRADEEHSFPIPSAEYRGCPERFSEPLARRKYAVFDTDERRVAVKLDRSWSATSPSKPMPVKGTQTTRTEEHEAKLGVVELRCTRSSALCSSDRMLGALIVSAPAT